MRIVENQCVGCETCTLGFGCSLRNVVKFVCDICGEDNAKYHIDDQDYCDECMDKYLDELFHDTFSIPNKAKIVDAAYEENY